MKRDQNMNIRCVLWITYQCMVILYIKHLFIISYYVFENFGSHIRSQLSGLCLILCNDGNISDSKGTQHSLTRPSAWKSFVFPWIGLTGLDGRGFRPQTHKVELKRNNMLGQNEAVKQPLSICYKRNRAMWKCMEAALKTFRTVLSEVEIWHWQEKIIG